MQHQQQENVVFDAEIHSAVHTVNFPFDEVDEALGYIKAASPTAREEAAELFRRLASWCFAGQGRPRTAMVRFVAIVSGLRPDLLKNMNGEKLGRQLGVTKQAITHQAVRFEDAWHVKFARGRSAEGRRHMAAARRGGPNQNIKR